MRKACWILPLLWGQIFIWSQLGVSWSCVSLQQPRSCPLARPVSGLGSSSVWRVFHPFYPVNPPPGQPVPAGHYAGCWLRSRLVIRQNCSLLMSFAPRKKTWSWYRRDSKHKAQRGKKLSRLLIFIGGHRYKSRVSIPEVMGMHLSQDNLPLGLYVVLRASFLCLTRCFSSEGVRS